MFIYSGVMQNPKRMLPATELLLTAGHAVRISDTFTAIGGEESVSTRSYGNFMFGSVAEMMGGDLHTVFEKGL
jgi:hypothetical protein